MNNGEANGEDPTARRRVGPEAQRDRDAEAWRLQRAGWSVRGITRELGMPPSSVQRCLARAQQRGREQMTLAAAVDGNPLEPDLLELYRWAWHPGDTVTAAEQAKRIERFAADADAYWAARGRPPQDGGRVSDGHSWRELCDAAMADDSGTDAADDW